MASTSWVVAQSQHALKQRINTHSKQKLNDNIHSKDILPRRLKFVRPSKPRNARPMSSSSSSSSSSSTPQRVGRQRSDFKPASTQLFNECDITPLMRWKSSTQSVGGGLRNLGNSCFMNATLQCLAYTAPFQNYIASQRHTKKCKTSGYCIFCELQQLMPTMIHTQSTAVPHAVFRNLRLLSKKLRPGRQEDAQEFLRFLMEGLQNSCLKQQDRKIKDMRIEETTFIHKLWGGYLRSQIKCCKCGYESNTYDSILDISLEIKGPSVRSAFKHFTDPEILDDDNKYQCDHCKKKRRAIKQFTIFEPPNILVIHLKRFECGGGGLFSGGKINKHVHFDDVLDLTEYMSYSTCPKVSYRLIGVLVHYGYSSHGGHYVSYVRAPDGQWYLMDDSRCQYVSNINIVLKEKAYLLFYQRNETKVLYQSPTQSPNIQHIKTNKCTKRNSKRKMSVTSLDSLKELADSLPKHASMFEKTKTESRVSSTSHKNKSQSTSPALKPLRNRTIRHRKPLISTELSSSDEIDRHSTHRTDAALEWQQKNGINGGGKKRKYPAQMNELTVYSPPKKRKIDDDSRHKQLKLLKKRLSKHTTKQRSLSISSGASSSRSTRPIKATASALFVGRKSHTLRLAAKSALDTSPHKRRRRMGSVPHKWKGTRVSCHGTLSDNSSESMFSDSDPKAVSVSSSSSRSPELSARSIASRKPMNTTLPMHYNHSNIVAPVHSIKNMKKHTDAVRQYFKDERNSSMSAIGIANVGTWSDKEDHGETVRHCIINEANKPIVEPKDEWDVMLDTGVAYTKHKKARHPFKDFNRNEYMNRFQMTQMDHGYKQNKMKKKKGSAHNERRFHSRHKRNVIHT
eukprot:278348_1